MFIYPTKVHANFAKISVISSVLSVFIVLLLGHLDKEVIKMPIKYLEQMSSFFTKLGIDCDTRTDQPIKEIDAFTATLSPAMEKTQFLTPHACK